MDQNNNSNPNPLTGTSTPPPSVDVNSMPPLDQTPLPSSTPAPQPPMDTPPQIPTMNASSPETGKKPFPIMMVAMTVLAAVLIIVLGYFAYTKLSGASTKQSVVTNDQPVDQEIQEAAPLDDEGGTMSADFPEVGTTPAEGDGSTTPSSDTPETPIETPAP